MTKHRYRQWGFSLVEMLAATAVLTMLVVLLFGVVSNVSHIWQVGEAEKSRQQIARIVLELIGRDLESSLFPLPGSTIGPQFLVNPQGAPNNPTSAFWQAAVIGQSQTGDVAEVGYFVQWKGTRCALCRYRVPASETDSFFQDPAITWVTEAKISKYAAGLNVEPERKGLLTENVLGLWFTLYDSTGAVLPAPYDSRTSPARPAAIEVAMAIVDPVTAMRIQSAEQVTDHYTAASVDSFVTALPPVVKRGTRTFQTRINLENNN